ncbi:MAG: 2-hydroxyacyl-CoA dehydratase family protein [Dehalococcoidia bacterium]
METKTKSRVLQEFHEASKTLLNPALKKEKEKGTKVIGYFCGYGPAEIITAAGMIPFRIRATGSKGTDLSDAYLSSINCSFCRNALNMGLAGDYDFLDGLIVLNNCDHVRRIYDNWRRKIKTPLVQMMSLPKKISDPSIQWYYDELKIVQKAIEDKFNVKITDDKLQEAIKLHNETRHLQRELYELRKKDNPPITGADTLAVMVAGTAMPLKQYNPMLKELIADLSKSEGVGKAKARLLVIGGILDDPEYLKIIESTGGLVVTDVLCFGLKNFRANIDEKMKDPIAALAKYYIADRPACPRMFGDQARRAQLVKDLIKEFKVDGVVGERLVFCDLWAGELYMLSDDLKEVNVPLLKLDREYLMAGAGQVRTRIQAFIESMGR